MYIYGRLLALLFHIPPPADEEVCNSCVGVSHLSFRRSQLPHRSVNLSFDIANIQNKLTKCPNRVLQIDINKLCVR